MAPTPARFIDPLVPGQRMGSFLLLAPLGTGGSGRVWAAARVGHLGFTKRMVLKVIREDKVASDRARQRFDGEAKLGAQLRHPNLRAVHELGSHEGRPYMVLAWVDASLAELLEHAPSRILTPEVACWFGIQTCEALEAVHTMRDGGRDGCPIVHGDVSPGNILLSRSGHVQLADPADPRPPAESRAREHFFGNPVYAAPEAWRGSRRDVRADLFSLGCVLYEALSGAPAFEGDEHSVMFQVLEGAPPDLARRAPHVSKALIRVVARAMARLPDERFQSARGMREALSECVGGHSRFALEELAQAAVHDVLGRRLREREFAMQATLKRFLQSQLERTDTLPLGNAAREHETVRPEAGRTASLDGNPGEVVIAPANPISSRARWSRPLWAALSGFMGITALFSLGLYWRQKPSGPQTFTAANAAHAADRVAPPNPQSAPPVTSAAVEQVVTALSNKASSRDAPRPLPDAGAKKSVKTRAARRASGRPTTNAPQRAAPRAPVAGSSPPGGIWQFPDNPYDRRGGADAREPTGAKDFSGVREAPTRGSESSHDVER